MSDNGVHFIETFLALCPGPFKICEMQSGPVDGPHDSEFMVQCQTSGKVLQSFANKEIADAHADLLNSLQGIKLRLVLSERVIDLIPKAFKYLTPCEEKHLETQVSLVEMSCNEDAVKLLYALRSYAKARQA